jgi:hypothetical protein
LTLCSDRSDNQRSFGRLSLLFRLARSAQSLLTTKRRRRSRHLSTLARLLNLDACRDGFVLPRDRKKLLSETLIADNLCGLPDARCFLPIFLDLPKG